MSAKSDQKIIVYFDGLCRVCDAEIQTYRKMKGAENIHFIDITSIDFDAAKEGLDPKKINIEMHARDEFGELHIGVRSFILIWSKLEKLVWLSRFAKIRIVRSILDLGYFLFTKIRPYLPRKSCETSPYCEIKKDSSID